MIKSFFIPSIISIFTYNLKTNIMKKEILDGLNVVNIEVNGTIVDPLDLKETPMFANRETLMEAFEYAQGVLDRSTDAESAIYGTTAIQVIWNTLATKYHLIPKE